MSRGTTQITAEAVTYRSRNSSFLFPSPLTLGLRLKLLVGVGAQLRLYTCVDLSGSRGNFSWVSLGADFSRNACVSLSTLANLLSSVGAIGKARLLTTIIVRFGQVSRLAFRPARSESGLL